jgi:4-amino-4-deoxy-L-arabinose transferase-like glycosyltransferase
MNRIGLRQRVFDPEAHYRLALFVFGIVTLIQWFSLPLVITYDGMEYIHLANLLFTNSFSFGWNYLRTPGFPCALKLAFFFGGEQPQAAMMMTALAGAAGALLTGSVVRTVAGNTAGAVTLIVLAFYPVLVCYEHMLLSETGIFLFLALLVWLLIRFRAQTQQSTLAFPVLLACVTALGYYWRPTILYLSPVVALSYLLRVYLPGESLRPYREFWKNAQKDRARAFRNFLIATLGPLLLAYPWVRLSNQHPSSAQLETVTNGMYKYVLVPPDDPVNAPLRAQYMVIIRQDAPHRRLPLDGLSIVGEGRFEFIKRLSAVYMQAGLLKLIAAHPGRYLKAVIRAFIYFLGFPQRHAPDDENWHFSRSVFHLWPPEQNFQHLPGWIGGLKQFEPRAYGGGAFTGRLFDALGPIYLGFVLLSSLASCWWFVTALRGGNARGLIMAGIPLALLFLHSLTMMAASRYAFPVYPLMMANGITLVSLAVRGWVNKRRPETL